MCVVATCYVVAVAVARRRARLAAVAETSLKGAQRLITTHCSRADYSYLHCHTQKIFQLLFPSKNAADFISNEAFYAQ